MESSNNTNGNAGIASYNSGSDGFDFKYLVAKVAGNWQWFALSLILCVGLAVLYILYAIPAFTITSRVLVNGQNANKIQSGVTETNMLNELSLFSQQTDVNNELQQIHARTLIEQTIRDLQTNVSYWAQGDIRFSEVYNKSPFLIDLISLKSGLDNPLAWDVRIDNDKVKFIDDFSDNTFTQTWGDTVKLKYCTFVLKQNPDVPPVKDPNLPLGLKIASFGATYVSYSEGLLTFLSAENTTSMDITLDASVPQKGEDFVNHLVHLYVQRHVDANNAVADSTISFINERIDGVARELSAAEVRVQGVLTSGSITDINEMGKSLIGESSDASKSLQAQQDKMKAVELVERYLNDPTRVNTPLPTTSSIDDQTYVSQVQKYNNLQSQRETQLLTTTENNPAVKNIDNQLALTRGILKNILKTYKESISYTAASAQQLNSSIQNRVSKAPIQQRQYLEASRRQDVLQQLYLYLLTVREQTQVTKSNNIAPITVIDPAQAGVYPYWPNKAIVIIAAIFLALVIPSAVILINELTNSKVITPSDIVGSTSAPLIAEISQTKSTNPVVVTKESRTAVAEQFRTLRTNLLFNMTGANEKVIMCTSTVSGEGKTFVSLNLACAMALSGKKVLLVDMELRKAQLTADLDLPNKIGLGDYFEKGATLNEIIQPSGINENLWALSSGDLVDNPSETLLNNKMGVLFEEMRRKFDFIIIDTPPAAVVTDALVVGRYSDLTLYVVRQKVTYKKHIDVIEDLKANNKLKNIYVILNDVQLVPGYNQGYGFGYRFDEDFGYYHEEEKTEKRPFLKRLFPEA